MLFGYLTLATALIISLSAAVYSILGLTAIFAAAFWPVVIMGGSLEIGKIVTTLWLHKYWDRAEIQYKLYLCSAVAILMLLTSMGVFGFLSKAHLDQAVPSGDIQAQVQIFDDKIQTQKDNIKTARMALTQMDSAVDQTMGRSNDEKGADKAVAIRRSQARERTALQNDISKAQTEIVKLQEQRAPVASQARQVEAEVGPIKYIAALIYGDNPDAGVLEKSVRWVIILIVIVFDPLALTLLLAATKALEWERGINLFVPKKKDDEEVVPTPIEPEPEDDIPVFEREEIPLEVEPEPEPVVIEPEPAPVVVEPDPEPAPVVVEPPPEPAPAGVTMSSSDYIEVNGKRMHHRAFDPHSTDAFHALERHQERIVADNAPPELTNTTGFGIAFPDNPNKGDTHLRVDRLPTTLYKFNGRDWIEVDKQLSTSYVFDDAYIDYLIDGVGSGAYDPDLLSDSERDAIALRLKNNPPKA